MAGGHPHRGAAGMGVLEPEHGDKGVHTVKGGCSGAAEPEWVKRASAWEAGSEQDAGAQIR